MICGDLPVWEQQSRKHGIKVEFLQKHESEVTDVILTEFDEKEFLEYTKKESFEEGVEDTIKKCLASGKTPEEIADFIGYDIDFVRTVAGKVK